jgi:hypothetical protein
MVDHREMLGICKIGSRTFGPNFSVYDGYPLFCKCYERK